MAKYEVLWILNKTQKYMSTKEIALRCHMKENHVARRLRKLVKFEFARKKRFVRERGYWVNKFKII